MYKTITAGLLALFMMFSCISPTIAQEEPRELVVANPTKVSGMFFTNRWGNNTSDIDVRTLLHGLGTVAYRGDFDRLINPTVVKAYHRAQDTQGHVTYTLTLWEDLRFSDGSPITAKDYAASVLLQASPELMVISRSDSRSYDYLLGFDAYISGESPRLLGLRLLDEYVLSLTIDKAYLPFYFELNLIDIVPYPLEVLLPGMALTDHEDGLGFAEPINQDALEKRLLGDQGYLSYPTVTSGPYRLVSYQPENGEVQVEKNPYFKGDYQGQTPSIERVRFVEAKNETMLSQLLQGQVDLLNKMTWHTAVSQARAQANRGTIQIQGYDRRGLAYLSFTCDEGVTASQRVRQAVASLVDREGIIREALASNGKPVYGYYGIGQELVIGKEDQLKELLHLYPTNYAAAEKLLVEDGWSLDENGNELRKASGKQRYRKEGDTLEPLVLRMAFSQGNPIAETVAKQLEKALRQVGGRLDIQPLETRELFQQYYRQQTRAFDILFLGSNFDMIFDPYHALLPLIGGQGQRNLTGIDDPVLLQLSEQMRDTVPGDKLGYERRWQQFQQRLVNQLPLLPLYSNEYYDAFTNDLVNYHPEAHFSWAQALLYARWR